MTNQLKKTIILTKYLIKKLEFNSGGRLIVKAKDIAEKLGLSTASVSLAMNNKPGVSQKTKEKVRMAMKEYSYAPLGEKNQQKLKTLLFLVHRKVEISKESLPYFSQVFENVIAGIEEQAKQKKCKLLIQYVDDDSIKNFIGQQGQGAIDGIVLLGTEITENYMQMLLACDIPIVLVDNYFQNISVDTVVMNNEQGVYMAISHLIEQGHSVIGYIHVLDVINNFQERYHGFLRSMHMHQLQCKPNHLIQVEKNNGDPVRMELFWQLNAIEEMPTAFFADNDIIAIEVYKVLIQMGYKIPEDISIIGFDNISYSQIMNPPLTTIDAPQYIMGQSAVNLLMEKIDKQVQGIQKVEIMTSLIKRQSVKRKI